MMPTARGLIKVYSLLVYNERNHGESAAAWLQALLQRIWKTVTAVRGLISFVRERDKMATRNKFNARIGKAEMDVTFGKKEAAEGAKGTGCN